MKIIFCNITYMKNYTGVTNEDFLDKSGFSWVREHMEAGEQYNFLDYNSKCYGYMVQDNINIERLEGVTARDAEAEDVLVVWCSKKPNKSWVSIVGWYKHATVLPSRYEIVHGLYGMEEIAIYNCYADAHNCHLLPEEKRIYPIPFAAKEGKGKGMGQASIWYADTAYAKKEIIPKVLNYIESYKGEFINTVYDDATLSVCSDTDEDFDTFFERARNCVEQGDYYEGLCLLNLALKMKPDEPDTIFNMGMALEGLFQFERAIKAYEKVVELEGESWDNLRGLPQLYETTGRYADVLRTADILLKMPEAQNIGTRCRLYSYKADAYCYTGRYLAGIQYLDKVIGECDNEEIIEATRENRKDWLGYMEEAKRQ